MQVYNKELFLMLRAGVLQDLSSQQNLEPMAIRAPTSTSLQDTAIQLYMIAARRW